MVHAISIASAAIANSVDCGRFWRFSANLNLLDLSWISFNCTPHYSSSTQPWHLRYTKAFSFIVYLDISYFVILGYKLRDFIKIYDD